jgi:hypothetical protein
MVQRHVPLAPLRPTAHVSEAIARAEASALEAVESALAERGPMGLRATRWVMAARLAGAHRTDVVSEHHVDAYYAAYERVARAAVEELAGRHDA